MDKHFEKIKQHCYENSRISEKVIDNFLMDFVAKREDSGKRMNQFTKKYKHIIRQMPKEFFPSVMAEYIIGKTFMQNGLIHKYLNHPAIKSLGEESFRFLNFQSEHPWRYCFARIINHPEKEIFMFHDEFLDDEFLLYSPGVEAYCEANHENSLYFMLIGFNGECWQTYGIIIPFRSFDTDDIYFYGTEVFPEVDSDESLMESVYQNPMPYFILGIGMELPVVVSNDHILRQYVAVDNVGAIDTDKLRDDFSIQWNKDIYRFNNDDIGGHPHFAKAYFIEETGELQRHAMTQHGFNKISRLLIDAGLKIRAEENFTVALTMLTTMKQILKKNIVIDEYEKDFPEKNENEVDDETLEKINRFMEELIPYVNTGQKPDIKKLAEQYDLDKETAKGIYNALKNKTS